MNTREQVIQKVINSQSTGDQLKREVEDCLERILEPFDSFQEHEFGDLVQEIRGSWASYIEYHRELERDYQ